MHSSRKLSALSSAILIASLTACGGGGGGGGGEETPRNPEPTLTTLPAFLQGNEAQCTFTEGSSPVSPVNYTGNLSNVTGLTCTGVTLSDLNGIDLLTALQQLKLENAGLTNVTDLLNNLTLKQLDVSGNPITDLTVINSLLSLTELDLENTGLADISLLEALTALQKLDVSGNGITNVTALANLLSLTDLDVSGNNITKLDDLGALINLQNLDVSGNPSLSCAEINDLDLALAGATDITVPNICTTALFLSAASDASQSLDNSAVSEPFDRLVVKDVATLDVVKIFQSGDNLRLEASTSGGLKSITFTSWFTGDAYQVDEFEIEAVGVYSFTQLRNAIGLGLELTEGKDTYLGTDAKDVVYGLGEADIIAGGYQADIIVGGPGDDSLSDYVLTLNEDGSVSRPTTDDSTIDTFIFNSGDGNDTLYLYEDTYHYRDTLKFGVGITEDDLTLIRDGDLLKIILSDTDSITLPGWFLSDDYRKLGKVLFGSSDYKDAKTWVTTKGFSSVDSTILGTSADDTLIGSSEDDIIIADYGKDIIIGSTGDDVLSDYVLTINEDGSVSRPTTDDSSIDTFVFNIGDGNDTLYLYEDTYYYRDLLQFTGSISEDDITLYRDGVDLKMVLSETDSVTVSGWFTNNDFHQLGRIQFGNESVDAKTWVLANFVTLEAPGTLEGTAGIDHLLGTTGKDIIIAGYGKDVIVGDEGDDILSDYVLTVNEDGSVSRQTTDDNSIDTFVFNSGDGNDTLYLYEETYYYRDQLQFGTGITDKSITAEQLDNDLKLTITTIESVDSITIKNWVTHPSYRLGQIQFEGEEPQNAEEFINSLLNP